MARLRIDPTYRFLGATGRAIVTYYEANRQRRSVLLPGPFNSKESLVEYKRIRAILRAGGEPKPQTATRTGQSVLTITELIERCCEHVKIYYRRVDGSETQEVACMMYSLRPLNFLFSETLVKEFGPSMLKAVRELMIDGYMHPNFGPQAALSRLEINKRIIRSRQYSELRFIQIPRGKLKRKSFSIGQMTITSSFTSDGRSPPNCSST